MAVAFEHYGQTVAPAAPPQQPRTPQPQAVPAYAPPQAQVATGQAAGLRDQGLLGARVLLLAGTIATLGAHMASDGSWFQLLWWRVFGWHGYVDLPLVLLPLVVILAVCWLLVWGGTALVAAVAQRQQHS